MDTDPKSLTKTEQVKPEPQPGAPTEKKDPEPDKPTDPVKETVSGKKSESPKNTSATPSDPEFTDIKETEKDIAARKHDHNGYMAKIRTAARDKINKEPEVFYATLCNNDVTQVWSLIVYKRKEKSYWFATYSWSEIDGKFDEPTVSNKYPLTGLKNHLSYSSADRHKCEVIKGRPE